MDDAAPFAWHCTKGFHLGLPRFTWFCVSATRISLFLSPSLLFPHSSFIFSHTLSQKLEWNGDDTNRDSVRFSTNNCKTSGRTWFGVLRNFSLKEIIEFFASSFWGSWIYRDRSKFYKFIMLRHCLTSHYVYAHVYLLLILIQFNLLNT